MRLPRNPPDIESMLSEGPRSQEFLSEEVGRYAEGFNRRYLHWSEVCLRDTGPFDSDVVWARMKMIRNKDRMTITFGDTDHYLSVTEGVLEALSEFDGKVSTHPMEDVMDTALIRESIASSQAEGATTAYDRAEAMLLGNEPPKDTSERMIRNNHDAMLFVRDNHGGPLTPGFILTIHRIMTEGILDEVCSGRFRDNDSVVVQDTITGEISHQPITHRHIGAAVQGLCDFINDDGTLPLILKGIILHYAIAFIHPFEDGNGRVARCLFHWCWFKGDHGALECLPLSEYIRDHKGRYERSYVLGETDGNDMTYFVLYHLRALSSVIDGFDV